MTSTGTDFRNDSGHTSTFFATEGFRFRECMPVCAALMTRLALLLLVLHARGSSALIAADTESYIAPGMALFRGHFGWPLPEIDRTPGYPVFAILTGMWGNHLVLTVIAQILVDCFSTWLVMRIASQIFPSSKAGVIAGYLYAFEPLAILSTCAILPDSPCVAMLLAMTTLLLEYEREPRWKPLVSASLCLAASAYLRPVSYYLPFFLGAYLLVRPPGIQFSRRLKASALFVLVCVSSLAVWQFRNHAVAGYSGFSSVAEKNLYFYLAAGVQAKVQHRGFIEVQKSLGWHDESRYLAENPGQTAWSRTQRLAFMRREAIHTIAAHPLVYAKLHATGMALVLFAPPATDFLRLINRYPEHGGLQDKALNLGPRRAIGWIFIHRPDVFFTMVLMFILLAAYYACALRGVVRTRAAGKGLLCSIGLYFVLVAGGPQAVPRYRLPLVPVICVFAGAGIASTKTRSR